MATDPPMCPHCLDDLEDGVAGGLWVCLTCRDQFTEDQLAVWSDTLRMRFAVISRQIDRLPWPARWLAGRRLRSLMAYASERRDDALRRWWNDPR